MAFFDALGSFGDRTALITDRDTVSYARLDELAKAVGKAVPGRSLAFCLCKNDIGSIAGYLGLLQRGAVPVLIQPTVDGALLAHLTDVYKPQYIWAQEGAFPWKTLAEEAGYALTETASAADTPRMDPDLGLLLTTSGSTGSPKLVRQTYTNIQANAASIVDYLGIGPGDRPITTLPMHYTYGLSILHSHLLAGASMLLTEATLMEKSFWNMLREGQATTFGGVPYTYEMLMRLRFLRMELPSLRYLTQAGGRLGKELHLAFAQGLREKGVRFVVMYGQTEATARMSYVPAERTVEKAGSIGIPIPGGAFTLIDDRGQPVTEPETTGELVYTGPNVTPGYAGSREDLANGDERHGRLLTGDMARFDGDGYYYIVGRKKRFLKMFGSRVNLDEVEGLLKKQGWDCAVTGQDDHMKIFITAGDTAEVLDYVAATTKLNRSAFTVKKLEKLPRNDAGKLIYGELE